MATSNICRLSIDRAMIQKSILSRDSIDIELFEEKIRQTKAKTVMLDMSNISFMDSGAVVTIVQLHKLCKQLDKQFSIEKPRKLIKDLLHTVNLDRVIPIVD